MILQGTVAPLWVRWCPVIKKEIGMEKFKKLPLVKNIKRHWELYLLILPVILYFAIFCYGPMYGIQIAFKDYVPGMDILDAEWVGLKHFRRVFKSNQFITALKNTLTLSLIQLVLGFPFPIMMAILLNEMRFTRMKKILQSVSYAPHFISTVAMAGIILAMTTSHGLIGQIATAVTGESTNILTKPDLFKWIYFISNEWKNLGWSSIIYIATLSSVDITMYEAAKVDGANRLQKVWYLDIPFLIPTMVILLILNSGRILSVGYEQILMLQNDLNLPASEIISTYSYKVGLLNRSYGFSTAIGLFNSVVNLILLTTVNKISNKVSGNGLW